MELACRGTDHLNQDIIWRPIEYQLKIQSFLLFFTSALLSLFVALFIYRKHKNNHRNSPSHKHFANDRSLFSFMQLNPFNIVSKNSLAQQQQIYDQAYIVINSGIDTEIKGKSDQMALDFYERGVRLLYDALNIKHAADK